MVARRAASFASVSSRRAFKLGFVARIASSAPSGTVVARRSRRPINSWCSTRSTGFIGDTSPFVPKYYTDVDIVSRPTKGATFRQMGSLGILFPVYLADLGLSVGTGQTGLALTLELHASAALADGRATRQAWVMAIVENHEREVAASATNLGRTVAAATPALTGDAGGRALGPVGARRPAEDGVRPVAVDEVPPREAHGLGLEPWASCLPAPGSALSRPPGN